MQELIEMIPLPELLPLSDDDVSGRWRFGGPVLAGLLMLGVLMFASSAAAHVRNGRYAASLCMSLSAMGVALMSYGIAVVDIGWLVIGGVSLAIGAWFIGLTDQG